MTETTVEMDGSQGEGGGQILRSSLTLAALLGRPLRMHNIRSGRQKPGLLRQHLAAVKAAATVCDAHVEGAELGSRALTFVPGAVRSGRFHFAVGSAGSATLVCQTVLPILLGRGESELVIEGGTHNQMAPPYDFLAHIYFPLLRRMGVTVEARLERAGFYPAGGGRMVVQVAGQPGPVPVIERTGAPTISAWVTANHLPETVVKRMLAGLRAGLDLAREAARPHPVASPGPGGVACVLIEQGDARELVTAFAQRGRTSEAVAEDAVTQARVWLAGTAPVGEHLADMLVLLVALYGGSFHAGVWSMHSATHVHVVRAFLGEDAVHMSEHPDGIRVRAANPS